MASLWLRLGIAALFWLASQSVAAESRFIVLQSTTSTHNSGLLDEILPRFTEKTGIEVRVVAVGTGQALKNGENGDADLLLVHARSREDEFIAKGYGVDRRDVMFNDFVFVGPGNDPAGIRGLRDGVLALQRIAASRSKFASRGDDSGTHIKEESFWAATGINPTESSGTWYLETGSGMGATLNTAVGVEAYALTDRATWVGFKNKADFEILVEGDPRMHNPYGLLLVNPERHPHVKVADATLLMDWLTGPEGQQAISGFRIMGERLFFPNASP